MKKILLVFGVLIFNLLSAQEVKFSAKTGDVEMDGFLNQVNTDAKKDVNAFSNMIIDKFKIAKSDVDKLLKDMLPGDVYMAAQVSVIIGKPVTDVSSTYMKNKGKGWGEIAKEMGIKPGSPEFHQLKKSMKKSGGNEEGESHGHGKGNGHGHGKK